ncbi:MAG: EboA domain-containing protein [Pseudomonadota bacterium]
MTSPADLLRDWVLERAGDQRAWVEESLRRLGDGAPERDLHVFLGLAPRRLGKADLAPSDAELAAAEAARPGWRPGGWSVDGAARVLALLSYQGNRAFAEIFKDLRRTADAGEMVALYRGLALYPEPETLEFEAGEGLRSNLKPVFEAIAHDNPYPRDHFDEHRWNHMVLKALFVGARLAPILGLDARANPELARILHEYAHERWAAGRTVTPELWRCAGPFAESEAALADLERALGDGATEAQGAALALSASPAPRARTILADRPEAKAVAAGTLTWDKIGEAA